MRIIVIGATGTLGRAIVDQFAGRHQVVTAGRSTGEVRVDLTDPASISGMYTEVGDFDAVVCAAGAVTFAPLADLTSDDYEVGLRSKLMGQVNLVLLGRGLIADGGSFTLTSGVLSADPVRGGSSASMVNGALDAFVRAAAIELPRGIRINSVSPTAVAESMPKIGQLFAGFRPVTAADAALGYVRSVEGGQTGQVYRMLG